MLCHKSNDQTTLRVSLVTRILCSRASCKLLNPEAFLTEYRWGVTGNQMVAYRLNIMRRMDLLLTIARGPSRRHRA